MCHGRIALPDYLAVGNPTLDAQGDGSAVLGGSAVYSALQAAMLGASAVAIGRADPDAIRPYWQPYANQVDLRLQPSPATTTFRNVSDADAREQWLLKWAGEIDTGPLPDSDILHVAPVAREVEVERLAAAAASRLVCLTPQGLLRRWSGPDGHVSLEPRRFSAAVAAWVGIVVVSEHEAPYVSGLLQAVAGHGGLAVVTRGQRGCEVLAGGGWSEYPAEPAHPVADATGAGDCFAATLAIGVFGGQPVPEAIRLASIAAALCVRGVGAATIGSRQEIMAAFRSRPSRSAT
jgi:sugar/nucleoside kinase (ribokinase family)